MSIYCTIFDLDEHTPKCARISKTRSKNVFHQDDSKPCTCGAAPILYQGSHVLPQDSDARGGSIDLGAIPSHITRDGRDDKPEGQWYPWLRVSVGHEEILLTKKQVENMRDVLNEWIEKSSAEEQ